MKLYTEKQVRNAIELAQKCEHECGGVYFDYTETEIIENLTPIELPSDEEIEEFAQQKYHDVEDSRWFEPLQVGAKWMKEQILKNK